MAPDSLVADPRRSLLATARIPRTATPMTSPISAMTMSSSIRVKPCGRRRSTVDSRRFSSFRRAPRPLRAVDCEPSTVNFPSVPGLDVVAGPLLLVGARGDHVGAVGVVLARALDDEVLAPRILEHLLEVALGDQVVHPLRTLVVVLDHVLGDGVPDLLHAA